MKVTEFMVVILAALLFLIPTMKKEKTAFEREEEEAPIEEVMEAESPTFKITYEIQVPNEEPVGDIIWMKKAAEVANKAGIPYFNVLEQKVKRRFVEEYQRELSIIEGVIELKDDPMKAEYDANEIEALILSEAP